MSPEQARSAARRAFGGVAQAKEHQRETRTFTWLGKSKLDVKLGLRMLAKYPGLSLVSITGMALAIAIAAGYFGVINAFLDSPLPLDEGDRVVAIRNRVVAEAEGKADVSPQDFRQWREELKRVRELSAFSDQSSNLIIAGRSAELVTVAAMTASGFRVARVAPALGRPILDEDERPEAPPIVVIAYEEWQRLFNGDEKILGRTLQLNETTHTIVGVMPNGFAFPVRHRFWIPLRLTGAAAQRTARHR